MQDLAVFGVRVRVNVESYGCDADGFAEDPAQSLLWRGNEISMSGREGKAGTLTSLKIFSVGLERDLSCGMIECQELSGTRSCRRGEHTIVQLPLRFLMVLFVGVAMMDGGLWMRCEEL